MTQYVRFPTVSAAATTDVNLTEVGGVAISLGQKTVANSFPVTLASNQPNINVVVASSALPSGAAMDLTVANFAAKTAAGLVTANFDEVDLTYVPSGNGAGQVATAVYKLATITVKTLTMTYDSSDRLTSVVAS